MTIDAKGLKFPAIKSIDSVERNTRAILQPMKERIEKYPKAFEDLQAQISSLQSAVASLTVEGEQNKASASVKPPTTSPTTPTTSDDFVEGEFPPSDDFRYTAEDFIPIGSGKLFFGSSAPTGYFLCDGTTVSRTTYARLFAVIGTVYGVGDGATTFNLPNIANRFLQGVGFDALGAVVGNVGSVLDLTHNHAASDGTYALINSTPTATTFAETPITPIGVATDIHSHIITGDTADQNANEVTGIGVDVDIRPETLVVNFIIKY